MLKQIAANRASFFIRGIVIFVICLQFGCPFESEPQECIDFFNTKNDIRDREFVHFDLEKQLMIQRCGFDQRPPALYAHEIANGGAVIIPALTQKLEDSNKKSSYEADISKYLILDIFRILSKRGQLKNDPEIIGTFRRAVSAMKVGSLREGAEESLVEIESMRFSDEF